MMVMTMIMIIMDDADVDRSMAPYTPLISPISIILI